MTDRDDLPPGYPHEWEADVVLTDGSVAHVRPIVPADAERIHAFHALQSEESVYLRFFAPIRRLSDRDVHRFTHVDYDERVALVVTIRGEIAGIGRYDRLPEDDLTTAEVAFNVADRYAGRGIGSVLLEHLADIGREAGVRRFVADVLPQNRRMIGVFADAGYEITHEFDDGVIAVSFDIEPTEASDAVRLSREHRAEAVSMHHVLTPRGVAVVGASRSENTVGQALYRHIRDGGFTGRLYPVNASGATIDGVRAYPRVSDIEEPVDLAVIAVPAEAVLDVVRECADAGVQAVSVVSAGFAEDGPEGVERQRALLRTARDRGMRVLGPNSFGLINLDPEVSLNASLSPRLPPHGRLGLFAQSGALGIAVLASAERRGLGISTFASAGNRVDISGNDLMQYWIDDPSTMAVGLYLESMGNPRKFSRIARQLAEVKPVIVVKSGVSRYGVPPGHTVRVTRERPEAFAEMLRQSGVIRAENAHQLFDIAQLVVHQPLPAGTRVGIVTNAAALGSLTADACVSWDLEVADDSPVAVPATAGAGEFAAAVERVLADPATDSVVASFVPPVLTDDTAVVRAVAEAAGRHDKTCVANFLGMRGVVPGGDLPTYALPEDAVRALAAATRYAQWRQRPRGQRVRPSGLERQRARELLERVLHEAPGGRDLTEAEATELLGCYGVRLWPSRQVGSAEEAQQAAQELGLPVILKATDPMVRHQPGQRWVRPDLDSPAAVGTAFRSLSSVLRGTGATGIAVQPMASPGVPVQLTTAEDPLFGPVVGFGVAGLPVDLLGDVTHRFPPLTDVDVAEMVASVRAAPLLDGYRGARPVDHGALYDLVARVSVLADDCPDVEALDLNPVMAHQEGVAVLGAEIRVAPAPGRADTARRALTPAEV
ncbi:bifunctional acetate--CoA ligase family protein/GNAT family N-acetyltransferase [Ornithinicoccus halotolerans]|uniref:bifunctional acetate--CoA ligase family protein/GNAT family N-acetyltransferase n=1 Tax=Ornithinicoccus halotolerans TaxID=1748220 RepID=UPI0012961781|nr:bifunctional GNAT family N-acetyltransferase/acetate--CoA ligase family protein [Ornithinicoccus halotolerans]